VSIAEMVRNQSPFAILPTWRRVVIVCCVGLAVLSGGLSFNREMNIYGGAPDHPVSTTGQTVLVFVNHGSARYVTQHEKENLDFWDSNIGLLTGAPILLAFFLWITFRTPIRR
jgi:hypothetical protein